jgi:aminodeoxyfutalosine synthase
VGGLHPDLPLQYFVDMLKGIKQIRPDMHVKAFTAVEIFFFSKLYKKSVVPRSFRSSRTRAWTRCPAAAPRSSTRRRATRSSRARPRANSGSTWHRTAHKLGMPSNCTMLYGHIETIEDRVDHLIRLRELQDETNGFVTFIPLAFQPWEAPSMKLPETTGFEDLKAYRGRAPDARQHPAHQVLLDHDRSPDVAQIGLSFGADDLDGTVTEEKVAHDAGAPTSQFLSVDELCRLIREAGRRPIERDTVFNTIREW